MRSKRPLLLRLVISACMCVGASLEATAQTTQHRVIASGFVGSNFANNADPASMNVGGSLAFLTNKTIGAEVELGLTPDFQLQNNFFGLGLKPRVGTFMANAIWARPFGPDHRWQPFVSGGIGALTLHVSPGDLAAVTVPAGSTSSDTRFGGNVGAGVMGFAGRWGFRADVRYSRATGSYDTSTNGNSSIAAVPGVVYDSAGNVISMSTTTTTVSSDATMPTLASAALSGLHFWRTNVGVAVRW